MALPRIASYPLPRASDLPASRGPWVPHRDRIALLVHDMQRYFVSAFVDGAEQIDGAITNIARLCAHARGLGIPVFYTAQNGGQDRRDRGLQADLWGPGMRPVAEHQDIVAPLRPLDGDVVLVKHRYSAFQRSNLESLLRARGRDQLIVTGIYAHIGCMATAVDAFQRDIEPFFVADAVADFSRSEHDLAVGWVAGRCGSVRTTRQLIETLA